MWFASGLDCDMAEILGTKSRAPTWRENTPEYEEFCLLCERKNWFDNKRKEGRVNINNNKGIVISRKIYYY